MVAWWQFSIGYILEIDENTKIRYFVTNTRVVATYLLFQLLSSSTERFKQKAVSFFLSWTQNSLFTFVQKETFLSQTCKIRVEQCFQKFSNTYWTKVLRTFRRYLKGYPSPLWCIMILVSGTKQFRTGIIHNWQKAPGQWLSVFNSNSLMYVHEKMINSNYGID